MAIVLGTNSGFVTVAPSADPDGATTNQVDTLWYLAKFTAPANGTVTEIGWYNPNATEEANFTVAISEDVAGKPEHVLAVSAATAKGTGAGWKKVDGFTQAIVSGTAYWLGVCQLDTTTQTNIDINATGGTALYNSGTSIPNPYVSGGVDLTYLMALYALYTASGGASIIPAIMANRRRRG